MCVQTSQRKDGDRDQENRLSRTDALKLPQQRLQSKMKFSLDQIQEAISNSYAKAGAEGLK
jgi:hypothetical protein